jgi:chromate transporter
MLLFAYGVGDAATSPLGAGLLHGLKLVAVAIVAQAVLGMARTLCPDRARAAIAAFAVVLLVIVPGSAGQIGAIFAGGTVALLAISLPGLLALVGAAPFWNGLRSDPAAQAVMRGVNAAVVGLLAASLYDPVWVSAVQSPADFAVVVVGFVLLVAWRAPPLLVVLLSAAAGIGLAMAQPHRF